MQQDQLAKGNRARQSKRITGSLKQILSLQPMAAAPCLKIPSSHQGHAITHFRRISICFRPKPPLKAETTARRKEGRSSKASRCPLASVGLDPTSSRATPHHQWLELRAPGGVLLLTRWGSTRTLPRSHSSCHSNE